MKTHYSLRITFLVIASALMLLLLAGCSWMLNTVDFHNPTDAPVTICFHANGADERFRIPAHDFHSYNFPGSVRSVTVFEEGKYFRDACEEISTVSDAYHIDLTPNAGWVAIVNLTQSTLSCPAIGSNQTIFSEPDPSLPACLSTEIRPDETKYLLLDYPNGSQSLREGYLYFKVGPMTHRTDDIMKIPGPGKTECVLVQSCDLD